MNISKLTAVDRDRLRHIVDRAAHFRREDAQGFRKPTPAPVHIIADMLAQRRYPLPEIAALVHAPFFAPSGRLVLIPGYDAETKRYLQLPENLGDLTVPPHPTDGELHRSLAIIDDMFCDFPFVSGADRANALAKLLDPFTRTIHDSITPLYVFTAPTPGTGKGLLADVLTIPATGARVMHTSFIRDEAELDKRFGALLKDCTDHVHFDNVEGVINSGILALFLTSELYSARVLGVSTMPTYPQRVNTSLSGNNVTFGGDIPRRVALIRLDAGVERPQGRTGFVHEDICGWAVENRALIVQACLTVVQSWVVAGMRPGSVTLGSFEKWARTTSGILEHAGIEGLLGNHREVEDVSDVDGDAWQQWVLAWWQTFKDRPVTPTDLVDLIDVVDSPPFFVADNATARAISISLGKALMKKKDRIFSGYKILLSRTDTRSRSKLWRLERVGEDRAS